LTLGENGGAGRKRFGSRRFDLAGLKRENACGSHSGSAGIGAWIEQYPDERDGFEQFSLMQDVAQEEETRQSR
jgi:hypothetical protein